MAKLQISNFLNSETRLSYVMSVNLTYMANQDLLHGLS